MKPQVLELETSWQSRERLLCVRVRGDGSIPREGRMRFELTGPGGDIALVAEAKCFSGEKNGPPPCEGGVGGGFEITTPTPSLARKGAIKAAYASFREVVETFEIFEPMEWSPVFPNLYRLKVELLRTGETPVIRERIVPLREMEIRGERLLMNGNPFEAKILEFPEETDLSSKSLEWIRSLGFNAIFAPREGTGTENADRAGLLVLDEESISRLRPGVLDAGMEDLPARIEAVRASRASGGYLLRCVNEADLRGLPSGEIRSANASFALHLTGIPERVEPGGAFSYGIMLINPEKREGVFQLRVSLTREGQTWPIEKRAVSIRPDSRGFSLDPATVPMEPGEYLLSAALLAENGSETASARGKRVVVESGYPE